MTLTGSSGKIEGFDMVVERKSIEAPTPGMLSMAEVASILHAHPSSVRRWVRQGILKCYRFGNRGDRKFSVEQVSEFIDAGFRPDYNDL